MRVATLLGATALIAIGAGSAQAGTFNGWYVGIEGGANWVNDNDAVFSTPFTLPTLARVEYDTGWTVLGTVGYAFENNWRAEFEAGYRQNESDNIFIGTLATPFPGSDLSQVTLMANVLYDIPLSDRMAISLGAGIGADNVSFADGAGVDDDSWGFAYQGIVGLSYAIGRSTEVTLNYRYLVADGGTFAGGPLAAVYNTDDFNNNTVTIGLRFDLSPEAEPLPPPPPPPPPPPAAPRQFIVFFGFNKSNLTEEAQNVVAEAAQAAKDTGSASIIVVGHTDTVGSAEYNQKLSERRAEAVRAALVALGVADGSISASGRGKTELLVQTGDNVKEPQNRRATINLDGPST